MKKARTQPQSNGERAGRLAAAGVTAFATFLGVLAMSAMGNNKEKKRIAKAGTKRVHKIVEATD